jgi:DnaD/phage-associated family protein
MARKRMIDPGFWLDEKLGSCEPLARLLFAGLISQADDEGRLPGRPTLLRSLIFPYDENITSDMIQNWLTQLADNNMIIIYTVDNQTYIYVRNFLKHQTIKKPTPSKYPPPPSGESLFRTNSEPVRNQWGTSTEPAGNRFETSTEPVLPKRKEEKRKEEKGKEERAHAREEQQHNDFSDFQEPEVDPVFARIAGAYMDTFGHLDPWHVGTVRDEYVAKGMELECVLYAFEKAKAKRKDARYAMRILSSWKQKEILTLEAAKAEWDEVPPRQKGPPLRVVDPETERMYKRIEADMAMRKAIDEGTFVVLSDEEVLAQIRQMRRESG